MYKVIFPVVMGVALAVLSAGCRSGANPYGADFQNTITIAKNKVFPAVVYIKVIRDNLKAGKNVANTVSGSGVVISADGEVVTNHHVVDKATEIRCLLYDGRAYTAKLIGSDKDTDLALLKLERPENDAPLPFAEFNYSGNVFDGDFVMAMGAPWGLNRSVSIGIVSCSTRYLDGHGEYTLWYQTDAAILPGNSGGPLVNTSGEVIGINTLGMGTGALAFSIPAHTAGYVIARLRAYGDVNWAWLGLILQPLRDFDRNIYFDYPDGVVVSGTEPGSPARREGILPQDVIVAVGGKPVNVQTSEDMPAFRRMLGLLPFDQPVPFDVLRDGKPVRLQLTPRAKGKVEGDILDLPRWEFTARAINRFDNNDLYFYRPDGVFVYGVHYSGQANRAQLVPNDIIVKVNDTEIHSLEDLKKAYDTALADIDNKRKTLITLLRNGALQQTVIDFSSDFDKE
jgi:serine protease Do